MKMILQLFLVVCLAWFFPVVNVPSKVILDFCHRGTYISQHASGDDVCLPCEPGHTFISKGQHNYRNCNNCSQVKNEQLEIIIRQCNITHDTEIQCVEGYYRKKGTIDTCVKCSICGYSSTPCQNYTDTFCCAEKEEAVLTEDNNYICKERPILCGRGSYFRAEMKECLPCPSNTFMTSDRHQHSSCLECQKLLNSTVTHAMIVHNCTATSPTIFGCVDGYFRDLNQEPLVYEATCLPCQLRPQQDLRTGWFQDASCNSRQDTNVSESQTNGTSSTSDKDIAEGEQLYHANNDSSSPMNQSCPLGLFYDETSHKCKKLNIIQVRRIPADCRTKVEDCSNDIPCCAIALLFLILFLIVFVFLFFILWRLKYHNIGLRYLFHNKKCITSQEHDQNTPLTVQVEN